MRRYILSITVLAALAAPSASPAAAPEDVPPLAAPVAAETFETFTASVSAYTSDVGETDEDPFTTASGSTVSRGTLACPSRYDFGTIVEISGKRYECEDRMNKRYRSGDYFDIWMSTKAEAVAWGRRSTQVTIIYEPEQSATSRTPDQGS